MILNMAIRNTKTDYKEMLDVSGADAVVGLDRHGGEISVLAIRPGMSREHATRFFPVVMYQYAWSRDKQVKGAQEFRDRIEYIYSPENDSSHPMLATWRLDDTTRLETTLSLPFGKKVLEAGCSSGTVSIEIAKLPQVEEVVGVDIRQDAIAIAEELLKKLVPRREISSSEVSKIHFKVSAIEDLDYPAGYFDSVCAFEILEHLVINDFHQAMKNMLHLLHPTGTFFISVPNRYPDQFYITANRARWNAPDHKNYFSRESLTYLLRGYFKEIVFHTIDDQPTDKGVYLFAEGRGKI